MFLLNRSQSLKSLKWIFWNKTHRTIPAEHFGTVIVFLGGIGDYLLFRPYLHLLKKEFGDLTLVGSKSFRVVAEHFDQELIGHLKWIDENQFNNSAGRKQILIELSRMKAERLICPAFSRQPYLEDIVCSTISSDNKIGVENPLLGTKSNAVFHQVIQTPSLFESLKFRDFLLGLNVQDTQICLPYLSPDLLTDVPVPQNAVVLFPSARSAYKRWSSENFVSLAEQLYQKFDVAIVLAGGPGDELFCDPIKEELQKRQVPVTDLCAKTSIPQLACLFSKARLLITNDTSSVHFAASVNCKVVVTLNGTHFGRFCPYPTEINPHVYSFYPPAIQKPYDFVSLSRKYELRSFLDINTIAVSEVFETCAELLQSKPATE